MIGSRDKKGIAIELIAIVVVTIIAIFFFAFWAYGVNILNTNMVKIPTTGNQNISQAVSSTFSGYNSGMQNLRYIGMMMMIGYIFATFIMAWLSRKNPIWMVVYFLIMILVFIFSVYVSNAYEAAKNNQLINSLVGSYVAMDYVLIHLPLFITAIGFVSIAIMLVGNYIDRSDI